MFLNGGDIFSPLPVDGEEFLKIGEHVMSYRAAVSKYVTGIFIISTFQTFHFIVYVVTYKIFEMVDHHFGLIAFLK